ncbi:MAG: asparaginase domain-containing protein [Saccharofermentans sp.]|nr:asparaginase domain-containing protein [Saccharofermentans sp.]
MRIFAALLGGTISSYREMDKVRLGKTSFVSEYLVRNHPEHQFIFPEFKTYSSEDATPHTYRDAIKQIMEEAKSSSYDGILITHGTDTCAYFAQLAARILPCLNIPFAITGSVLSPDVDAKEASDNLAFAVNSLENGKSGVVFRNREGKEQLYRADLIMSPDINGFYSEYEDCSGPAAVRDASDFLSSQKLPEILVIPSVPGALIPDRGFDRVLICCNHSGTASSDLASKIRIWTEQGISCYMAPIPTSAGVYESRAGLRDAGAIELIGMPIEGAWAEVLLR